MTRLSMDKFLQRQNSQLTRLFRLQDPMTEIIYISPFELSEDIIQYYSKVLQLGNIQNYKERLYFMHPQNIEDFPSHYTLSQLIIYSPKVIKRIKKIIKNKEAYIVPGMVSNDDIKLSDQLQIPILGGEPQKIKIISTKSGAMAFLNNLEIPVPLGIYEIYDLDEFYNNLSLLVSKNIKNNTWIFKIDNEFNGRGIASLNIGKLKYIKDLRQCDDISPFIPNIKKLLIEKLPQKLLIAQQTLYKNFDEYIKNFIQYGGIIEAMPDCNVSQIKPFTVFFFVNPDGEISLLGTYDKQTINQFVTFGCIYPQNSLKNFNSQQISQLVGQQLYKDNIFGFASVDFIAFPDNQFKNQQLFWAIGVDCYLNNYASSYFYFNFLVNGNFDPQQNNYTISLENSSSASFENLNERQYFYCPYLQHPGLQKIHYNTFFHMCRIEHIYYDIDKKSGATFLFLDSLQTGVLSLIGIGQDYHQITQIMANSLQFVMNMNGNFIEQFNNFIRFFFYIMKELINQIFKIFLVKLK